MKYVITYKNGGKPETVTGDNHADAFIKGAVKALGKAMAGKRVFSVPEEDAEFTVTGSDGSRKYFRIV